MGVRFLCRERRERRESNTIRVERAESSEGDSSCSLLNAQRRVMRDKTFAFSRLGNAFQLPNGSPIFSKVRPESVALALVRRRMNVLFRRFYFSSQQGAYFADEIQLRFPALVFRHGHGIINNMFGKNSCQHCTRESGRAQIHPTRLIYSLAPTFPLHIPFQCIFNRAIRVTPRCIELDRKLETDRRAAENIAQVGPESDTNRTRHERNSKVENYS